MNKKKLYVPPRHASYSAEFLFKNRIYTRYPFEAEAEIISDRVIPSRVLNISFGGCRLRFNAQLSAGTSVLVKIHATTDSFEATAKIIHTSANEAGVIFDSIGAQSLLVLKKWVAEARSAAALAIPNS